MWPLVTYSNYFNWNFLLVCCPTREGPAKKVRPVKVVKVYLCLLLFNT